MFLIEHNNKVIGVYESYNNAELFIQSCIQNNLMKNAKILTYRINSCLMVDTIMVYSKITNEQNQDEKNTLYKPTTLPTPNVYKALLTTPSIPSPLHMSIPTKTFTHEQQIELDNKKKESVRLQHKINMLKVYKERVEESKQVYENDLKLFTLFNKSKKDKIDFVIPELFVEKYTLFKKLHDNNNLSWESFIKEYKIINYYDDHFKLNTYEEKFLNYESDSDTDDSIEDKVLEELNI